MTAQCRCIYVRTAGAGRKLPVVVCCACVIELLSECGAHMRLRGANAKPADDNTQPRRAGGR